MEYQRLTVVGSLPASRHYPTGGEALFRRLAGATIICMGGTGADGLEGGGLILDYVPVGSSEMRRAVFAFNENGMWIEFEGPHPGYDRNCPTSAGSEELPCVARSVDQTHRT